MLFKSKETKTPQRHMIELRPKCSSTHRFPYDTQPHTIALTHYSLNMCAHMCVREHVCLLFVCVGI